MCILTVLTGLIGLSRRRKEEEKEKREEEEEGVRRITLLERKWEILKGVNGSVLMNTFHGLCI